MTQQLKGKKADVGSQLQRVTVPHRETQLSLQCMSREHRQKFVVRCGRHKEHKLELGITATFQSSPQGPTADTQVLTPKTHTASEEDYLLVLRTRACRDISGSNHGTTLPIQWPEKWASLRRVCSVFE